MKKYFFSLLAVVLAIGFSAFTPATKKSDKPEQLLYWYYVNSDFATVEPQNEVSDEPLEKSEAQGMVTCAGTSSNDCARGFSQPLQSSTTSIGTDRIKRTL